MKAAQFTTNQRSKNKHSFLITPNYLKENNEDYETGGFLCKRSSKDTE